MFAARLARVAALLLSTTPPPRCGPLHCTEVDEDALLDAFLGEPHPRIDAAQLSVDVPVEERKCSILSDSTLEAARDVLSAYGVVCLRGVWQAEPLSSVRSWMVLSTITTSALNSSALVPD